LKEAALGRPRELSDTDRANLLSKGYKPVEVWVPDVDNESYRAEAKRQAKSAAAADVEDRISEWIDDVSADAWDDL